MASGESLPVRVVKWPFKQVQGWLENFWAVVTKYKPDDFIPPAVTETLDWLKEQVPQAFGLGTPGEQMSSSVVLIIASIVTSVFTGGVTIAFVTLFALTFLGGALRLWPVVDGLWPFGAAET